MHNRAKQPNIPAELADNLISSLSGLTAIEGDELRRQIITLLINHSYALGYAAGAGADVRRPADQRGPAPHRPVAGAGAGLVAWMQSRLALARRRAGQDIKPALPTIRERITMFFRNHGHRSHQTLPL